MSFVAQGVTIGFETRSLSGWPYWTGFIIRGLSLVWTAFESLRYYGLMRRRQRVGLAEPLVADRFLLWGVSSVAATVTTALSAATVLATASGDVALVPAMRLLGSLCGLISGAATWTTFFPPAAYRRRFEVPREVEAVG